MLAETHPLDDLADRLERANDLSDIEHILSTLSALLPQHVRDEVHPLEQARIRAPELARHIDQVEAEYADELHRVQALRDRAVRLLAGPVAQIRREAYALAQQLRAVERHEAQILSDAFYSETGAGD